jgi:hypothetical protein
MKWTLTKKLTDPDTDADNNIPLHDSINYFIAKYSQTCVKRSPLGQIKSGLTRQLTS